MKLRRSRLHALDTPHVAKRAAAYFDLIPLDRLRAALAATTRTTAVNPFGPSDNPNVIRDMEVSVPWDNNLVDAFTYALSAPGRPWPIPLRGASTMGLAAGYEFRAEDLRGHGALRSYVGFSPDVPFSRPPPCQRRLRRALVAGGSAGRPLRDTGLYFIAVVSVCAAGRFSQTVIGARPRLSQA